VSHLIRGGTRVAWDLLPSFADPNPLTFQLQVGVTASNDSDDWADVGLPVDDVYVAFDEEQRVWGNMNWTHYRVQLTSASGVHYSEPTGGLGGLSRRDWIYARELIRKETKWHRLNRSSQEGILLKRRWTGTQCPTCLDPMTEEVKNPDCATCYGTGFLCGYYYPVDCVWAAMDPRTYRSELDGGQGRGNVNDIILKARMLNTVMLGEEDVWVNLVTDDRYYVHRVNNRAEVRGMAICADVELRVVPYSSVIYDIEIPQQLAALV
jgi:hypothetical protein